MKSLFLTRADFETILDPGDYGKQNLDESYMNKYAKDVACSYCFKSVYVDEKFSQPFKLYLDEDVVRSMLKESKYCSESMKKKFNKDLGLTKKDEEDFEKSTKCWSCDNSYTDGDIEVLHMEIVISSLNQRISQSKEL